mgnify:CR=1 FL=1
MQARKPLIGVVCGHQHDPERYYVNAPYIEALKRAEGIPVLIPSLPKEMLLEVLPRFDGILLPGGIDVDPIRFGEQPHPKCGQVDPVWDELDLTAAGWAMENQVPIFAICRGVQALNVAAGGTLIQDIPSHVKDPIKHQQEAPRWYATHDVSVLPGSLLASLVGGRSLRVNSFHHQAVRRVGNGLRVAASAPDGVIEAVEGTSASFVLGVQWHPELMIDHYPTAQKLFDQFVQAARGGQE